MRAKMVIQASQENASRAAIKLHKLEPVQSHRSDKAAAPPSHTP
jgi:hypothetical protein